MANATGWVVRRARRRRSQLRMLALVAPFLLAAIGSAAPSDVGPPDLASPSPQQLRSDQAGAFSVNEHSGTATYSYSFKVPPARGFAPSLGLSYTSSGATRGDIAQGFSLGPIPVVRRDVQREIPSCTTSGCTVGDDQKEYTASFGGSIEQLVKIPPGLDAYSVPSGALSVVSYRAQVEHDFTRYQRVTISDCSNGPDNCNQVFYWMAFTTDGRTYYFGDDGNYAVDNGVPHASTRFGEEYYLSHVVDRWGNTITYQYLQVDDPLSPTTYPNGVDRVLSTISYSANAGAGLQDHARVLLQWTTAPSCALPASTSGGQQLPVGAALDYSAGARRIRGAMQLQNVTTNVRPSANAAWQQVHAWGFAYDASRETCVNQVSAHRLLTTITETGTLGASTTSGPTVTFTYGADRSSKSTDPYTPLPLLTADSNSTAAGQAKYGLHLTAATAAREPLNPIYSMLIDMDGDSLPDLVQSTGATGGFGATYCGAVWYKNTGGQFDSTPHLLQLPIAPLPPDYPDSGAFWVNFHPMGFFGPTEGECSLAGSYFGKWEVNENSQYFIATQSTLYYRWVDIDNDGKVDLLAQLYQDVPGTDGYSGGALDSPTYPQRETSPSGQGCSSLPNVARWTIRAYHNVGGSLDTNWAQWCAPVAFAGVATCRECTPPVVGPGRPSWALVDIIDVNGDSLPDLVTASFTGETACTVPGDQNSPGYKGWQPSNPYLTQLSVFPNPGQLFTTGYVNSSGSISMPVPSFTWSSNHCYSGNELASIPPLNSYVLMDMNNDGLPDLVPPASGSTIVYNAGGFNFDPSVVTLIGGFFSSRQETYPNAFRDLDGDGIPDFPCMDGRSDRCTAVLGQGILFGNGGGFDVSSANADSAATDLANPYVYGDGTVCSQGNCNSWFSEQIGLTGRISESDVPPGATQVGDGTMRRVWRDYIDLDGDGMPERYVINTTQSSDHKVDTGSSQNAFLHERWVRNNDEAPSLLKQVSNGVGGTVTFHYARSTDSSVVQYTDGTTYAAGWVSGGVNQWINPAVHPQIWVVKTVDVSDGNGNTGSTSYSYFDPVVLADAVNVDSSGRPLAAARSRFRGFQAVQKKLPAAEAESGTPLPPLVFQRFNHRIDPDGVGDYSTLQTASGTTYVTQTISQTTYAKDSLLCGLVTRFRPVTKVAVDCPSNQDCNQILTNGFVGATQFATKTDYATPTPFSVATAACSDGTTLTPTLLKPAATTVTTKSAGGDTLQRSEFVNTYVLDNGPDYLVVPIRRESTGSGTSCGILTREEMFYDGASVLLEGGNNTQSPPTNLGPGFKGAVSKRRVYRNPCHAQVNDIVCTEPYTCADYGAWYDPQTGNLTRVVKPSTMANDSGDPSVNDPLAISYSFDPFGLFHTQVLNESAHAYQFTYDIGTGAPLTQVGPVDCSLGTPCDSSTAWNSKQLSYDGLGRLVREQQLNKTGSGYSTVHTLVYDPFFANGVFKNGFAEIHAVKWGALDQGGPDWDPSHQTYTHKKYDGVGRLVEALVSVTGVASPEQQGQPNEIHSYQYDNRGDLIQVTDPDPTNDAGTVTQGFQYDDRHRLKAIYPPNSVPLTISYDAWQNTTTDPDGNVKKQFFDGFGQMGSVQEMDGQNTSTTAYTYDGVGRLSQVLDGDGKWTILSHDGEGHRITIQRMGSGRFWNFQYDLDGHLMMRDDPDGWNVSSSYNERGQLVDESYFFTPWYLSDDHAADLGIGGIDYQYDAPSGSGWADVDSSLRGYEYGNRLERPVGMFMWTNRDGVYAQAAYGYDPQGNVSHEDWTLLHPQTGMQIFQVARDFGPLGQPEAATYPNLNKSPSWTYDPRAALSTVSVNDSSGATQLAQYNYMTSGHVHNRLQLGGALGPSQNHAYVYDTRGRLLSDSISVGANSISRIYDYTDDGDLHHLTFNDEISGNLQQGTTTFSYDGLHRLKTAGTSGAPDYEASLNYSRASRIQSATISGTIGADRTVGYAYAEDGVASDVQAVKNLTVAGQSDLVQLGYDSSGNMSSRVFPVQAGRPDRSAQNMQYEYDFNDQLRRATKTADGSYETYFYDMARRRFLELASDGSWRFQIGGEYEYEHKSDHDQVSAYVAGSGESIARFTGCVSFAGGVDCSSLTAQSLTPPVTLLHHDRRGDLLASFSQTGDLESHFIYGAMGELVASYQAVSNDWRRQFNEKERDQIDGLEYYGYRYYDPLTLQWTTSDPLLRFTPEIGKRNTQDLNLYAFTNNNPLRFRDPNGLRNHLMAAINEGDSFAPDNSRYVNPSQFGPNDFGQEFSSLEDQDPVAQGMANAFKDYPGLKIFVVTGAHWTGSAGMASPLWSIPQLDIGLSVLALMFPPAVSRSMREHPIAWALNMSLFSPVTIAFEVPATGEMLTVAETQAAERAAGSKTLENSLEAAARAGFGTSRASGEAAHHIVALLSKAARPAQQVLARFGIDINSAANGVYVNFARHFETFQAEYYQMVNRMMSQAGSRTEAVQILDLIRGKILSGKPW